jgi:hypothetical protein
MTGRVAGGELQQTPKSPPMLALTSKYWMESVLAAFAAAPKATAEVKTDTANAVDRSFMTGLPRIETISDWLPWQLGLEMKSRITCYANLRPRRGDG